MRVIVLDGNENQAVAAARALCASGHEVVVGSDSSWSKAGWSRAASDTFVYPSPQTSIDDFIARVVVELNRKAGSLILPMTERTTLPISLRRNEIIEAEGRIVLPSHETVLRAFDKRKTTELACSLGIETPKTSVISHRDEAELFVETARFPVVLKPRSSEEVSPQGGVISTGAPRYAKNRDQFMLAYDEMATRCSSFLAQEFVLGTGVGYFALMHNGELRAEFAHRRIRDVRPTGSGSAVRESVTPERSVREAALRILRTLKWHGVAMVEFRKRENHDPVFLEVNGRFWNSLPLAIYAGMNFPALLAEMAEHGDVSLQTAYLTGVRCRWLLGDFRHLMEVWRGAPRGYPERFPGRLQTLASFLLPVSGTFHDNFQWRDPLPEVGDWFDFLLRRIPAVLGIKKGSPKKLHVQSRYSLS